MAFRCEVVIGGTPETPIHCAALLTTPQGLRHHRNTVHRIYNQIMFPDMELDRKTFLESCPDCGEPMRQRGHHKKSLRHLKGCPRKGKSEHLPDGQEHAIGTKKRYTQTPPEFFHD